MSTVLERFRLLLATPTGVFAALVLIIDVALIAIRLVQVPTQFFDDPMFWLVTDGGYPEFYQYVKFGWLTVGFALLAVTSGIGRFALWSLVFCYLLIDDAATIHERMGPVIADIVPVEIHSDGGDLQSGGEPIGELMFLGLVGLLILALIAWAATGGPQVFKLASIDLVLLVGFVAIFGIVFDLAHALADPDADELLSYFFEFAEDGGEMVATSTLTIYAFHALICLGIGGGQPMRILHQTTFAQRAVQVIMRR